MPVLHTYCSQKCPIAFGCITKSCFRMSIIFALTPESKSIFLPDPFSYGGLLSCSDLPYSKLPLA